MTWTHNHPKPHDEHYTFAEAHGEQNNVTLSNRDPQQSWFWTPEWQAKEREAEEDIAAGRYEDFDNTDDFITSLDAPKSYTQQGASVDSFAWNVTSPNTRLGTAVATLRIVVSMLGFALLLWCFLQYRRAVEAVRAAWDNALRFWLGY